MWEIQIRTIWGRPYRARQVSGIFNLPNISIRYPPKEWLDSTCNFLAGLTGAHRSEARPVKGEVTRLGQGKTKRMQEKSLADTPEYAVEDMKREREPQSACQSSGM